MGKTGVGKSTLIDSYINYLTGVDYYDKFRFKLIDEREQVKANVKKEIAKGKVSEQTTSTTN